MPFFTVLTCSYNRAKELSRLYHSLQRQTFEDFVWLVMDDSTTDGVEKSIREWHRWRREKYSGMAARGTHRNRVSSF